MPLRLVFTSDASVSANTIIPISPWKRPWRRHKGTVIRATISFNLSRNIVALQVEILCCAYYHVWDQLVWQQNTVLLRQHVAQSRLEFYLLQQILVLLLVLSLKLQLVSQQIWIQRLWLAFAKPSNTASEKKTWQTVKTDWIRRRPVLNTQKLKS